MNQAAPLTDSKRLPWIDTARGFAILGIFLVNLPSFHGPYFLYGNMNNYWGTEEPGIWQAILDIFFQASFYTLFSFLFGFGMQIILENLKSRNVASPRKVAVRRSILLIIFGLIHGLLIWYGDILFTYGIIALLLLLFVKSKNVTLFVWSLCLLLIPSLMFSGLLYLASLLEDISNLANMAAIEASYQHYGNGTWGEIIGQNVNDWLYSNSLLNFIFVIFNILPMFLIGMIFARKKWLHNVKEHYKTLHKIWIISFILFLLFKAGPYLFGNPYWFSTLQDAIGGSASAVFYVITITFLYPKLTGLFQLIGSVGKLALSNYILQSIIGIFIFYSIGMGLYGKLSPFQTLLIGIIVFAVQIMLSHLWLQKYKRGPLEWLWRSMIYKKKFVNQRVEEENVYDKAENN
ncbi:DUF418 domain-containing protein [Gracilibacillus kekensis]|uniref:DUF418 domain-containing protein n=1 Tax=Gracilibacillus kekensis TaxID=1027249 RepID=A0A1M7ISI9_9BACI|nr:DUF418 domain-containing protein [Gracilibacillus kekensis]SHM43583.1 uncharacterized protein SAMN05216179_0137 [Gracilibacillus kekensis]